MRLGGGREGERGRDTVGGDGAVLGVLEFGRALGEMKIKEVEGEGGRGGCQE